MSSIASAICDAVITLSVMYYLRPTRIRYDSILLSYGKLSPYFYWVGGKRTSSRNYSSYSWRWAFLRCKSVLSLDFLK